MKRINKQWMVSGILFLVYCLGISASQVRLDAALSQNYLSVGENPRPLYLKVGLKGFPLPEAGERSPINVAIVLDKSGSMQGDKIRQAREAAVMAVNRLDMRDIVSLILYDDVVSVLVPATKVSDKEKIIVAIRRIEAGGSTALFAGVSKGAAEVRKFLDKNRVNRVILLSDGLANVGPDTPGSFADLGASLIKEGMAVSTIGLGLGYNEDLMVTLAEKSDGNHAFVERSEDLVRIFNYEFGDVLSVVAQEVAVEIQCAPGVRPVRVLGRDADISGNKVYTMLNQLYSEQEKYVLLELEATPGADNTSRRVADVKVSYTNLQTKTTDKLSSSIDVSFSASPDKVLASENPDVMVAVTLQIATINNAEAVRLRDLGNIPAAQTLLQSNALLLQESAEKYESEELYEYGESNADDALNLDESVWNERRKSMTKDQYSNKVQQSY